MGEGPKNVRDDDEGRFDAPRHDDLVGRGDPDIVGRGAAGAEPMPPATGVYPPGTASGDSSFGESGGPPATRDTSGLPSAPTREMAEIRAEIEQKRADISETIDEITERLSPGNLASQASDSAKDAARDTMRRVADRAGETARRVADTATDTARRVADTAGVRARSMADTTRRAGRTGRAAGARASLVNGCRARGNWRGGLVDGEPPLQRHGGVGRGRLQRAEPLLRR